MLEQLELKPGERVLEIGTGSGYTAALMAHVVGSAGRVVSLDIDQDLVACARRRLSNLGYAQVDVFCADGALGHPESAPFDAISVTVGAWDIAPAWWDQLRLGGRVVIPLWLRTVQRSIAFRRLPDHLESVSIVDCDFSTSLRGAFAPAEWRSPLGHSGMLVIDPEAGRALASAAPPWLLTAPSREAPIGLAAAAHEIFSGLYLWLASREAAFAQLAFDGGDFSPARISCLLHFPGKSCSTAGLVSTSAAAFLTPPPDWTGCPDPFVETRPFELWVRTLGTDCGPADRLMEQAKTWEAAGRPSTPGLHVSAYPSGTPVSAAEDDLVIHKACTTLVLRWQRRPSG